MIRSPVDFSGRRPLHAVAVRGQRYVPVLADGDLDPRATCVWRRIDACSGADWSPRLATASAKRAFARKAGVNESLDTQYIPLILKKAHLIRKFRSQPITWYGSGVVLRSSIITYDGLPVSKGGAHRLRTPNPRLAMQQARDFLTACTDSSIPKVAFVEVIRGHSFDDEFSLPLIELLTSKLGGSSRRQAGTRNIAHRWNLKADQIDEYVDMMNEALPLPVDPFGLQPFVVAAQINFRILDPQTCVALSGQESELYGNYSAYPGRVLGTSQLFARISGRSTFSLFLNFPFERQTAAFLSTATHVQDHLPFPLSQNHWKQWRLTKNGIGYVGRRVIVQAGRASSKDKQ